MAMKKIKRVRCAVLQSLIAAMFGGICLVADTSFAAERPIVVGVVLDGTSKEQREPLRAYLTKAMGRPVEIAAPDTFRETVAHLADDSYDFACLGALMYIRAHANYGVIPLVQRATDLHYRTEFITGTNSLIYSLNDLKGKQFAFGDIDSTSAHLMAKYELQRAGIDPESELRIRYSGSHPATAAMVEHGVVDAGAIDKTILDFLIRVGKVDDGKIRVFYTSDPYVDYVWVARKDVPQAQRERFARALLALRQGQDDSVLKMLRAKRFVVAYDQEYTLIRQIAHDLRMF